MAAGNAIIGALRAVLGIDTAQFETGLKSAQSSLSGFGATVAKAGAVAAAAMAATGVAIGVAVKQSIDHADQLGKMAQKVGIPVEELSALRVAAELSDVSMESLGKSMGKLSKAMVESAAKPTSEAANAFRALGISVTNSDGTLKSSSEVMGDIAGKFEGLKDGAGKTAVSLALFGRAGQDLIPMLNQGKDGLEAAKREAAEFGIVLSTQTAKAAEEFNDNLTRLGFVKDGIIQKITAGMLPALQNLSKVLVDGAKNTALMNEVAGFLSVTLQGVVSVIIAVGAAIKIAINSISTLVQALMKAASGDFAGAWDTIKQGATSAFSTMEGAFNSIKGIWTGTADGANAAAGATGTATKALREFNYAAMGGKTAVDAFLESQRKSLAAQQAELATVGMAAGAKERLRVVEQALQIAQTNGIPITEALRLKISETAFAAENLALKLQGAQLVQQNLTPGEMFRQDMENNRLAMERFGATADQIAQVNQAVAERYGNTWGQVGQSVAGSFQNIGNAFAKESKSMAMVAKVAGIAQATISMFVGAAKALELPFPANLAAWASVLATGAGAVAGIKGVATGGFKTGGAITVPGGMGGGDSVRAMVDLQPGEQLDIWRPGEAGNDPRRGAGKGGTIVLQGVSDDHWYSGKQLRKFVEAYNDQAGELRLQMA